MDYFIKMSASGTNASTDYYYAVPGFTYNGAANNASGSALTSGFIIPKAGTNAYMSNFTADVFSPFEAQTTLWSYLGQSVDHGYGVSGNASHLPATSYNGFSIVFASGTSTGECTVYGYQD